MSVHVEETERMWQRSCLLSRLVSSSVKISEKAGNTEADRSAQYCIVKSLKERFSNRLKIIGEETDLELSFSPNVLAINEKVPAELREIKEEDLVIWVNPLDGISEVAHAVTNESPLLQRVTVLIGIAHKGQAIAG